MVKDFYTVSGLAVWDPPTEGWVTKMIKQHLWKVQPELEFEDLFQEAIELYIRCKNKKPDSPNIMPYFKTAFANHIIWRAQQRTRKQTHEVNETRLKADAASVSIRNKKVTTDDIRATEIKLYLEENPELADLVDKLVGAEERGEPAPRRTRNRVRFTESQTAFFQRVLTRWTPGFDGAKFEREVTSDLLGT